MKGGGWNAESTQVGDGRRASPIKCRDCDNEAMPRRRLCGACSAKRFDATQQKRKERTAERYRRLHPTSARRAERTDSFMRGLMGTGI